MSWLAACWACAAVVFIHATYGATAATIAPDDGPTHGSAASCDVTVRYDVAAELNSAANFSQAAAAATHGSDPAPAYIRAELTSGGRPPKSKGAVIAWPP
ncbi:hypothetical protein MTY59_03640 [Mycobacterium senriense]|uniref:Uncharacterized protein n=1 Tax=Mycobacterium senriense TaxID=2775496 RepID=A0ABM7SHJ2_9MYCO|nr:hypothetical protein MTY59_03640 [Mycobacterium senriense]